VYETNTTAILYQNTPNPFTNTTIIRYYLPEDTKTASIQVTDLQGKLLEVFSIRKPGEQQVSIDGGRLPAGTYMYTLFADGARVDSKKMILTK